MAKSMAASLTVAVWSGFDAARRSDGYGIHAYCDPRGHTAPVLEALYDRARSATASEWMELSS